MKSIEKATSSPERFTINQNSVQTADAALSLILGVCDVICLTQKSEETLAQKES